MPKTTYPTAADLKEHLYSAGLIDSPTDPTGRYAYIDYETHISEAVTEFERTAGRRILAVTATKYLNPPVNRYKRLFPGDFLSITSISFLSQTFVVNTDYILGPRVNPFRGLPYYWVDFYRSWDAPIPWAQRQQLTIAGRWGFSETVPDAVWSAMVHYASAEIATDLASLHERGLVRWSEADVQEDRGEQSRILKYGETWAHQYRSTVALYKNFSQGLEEGP